MNEKIASQILTGNLAQYHGEFGTFRGSRVSDNMALAYQKKEEIAERVAWG